MEGVDPVYLVSPTLPISPTHDFSSAGQAVIRFLYERLGFNLWMVTRTEEDAWIVLQTEDHGYNVKPPAVFRWADSFCSQMVAGRGPRIAPSSMRVPAYAAAPIGRQMKIESYIGVPINNADGSLFGTLCAIHPAPQPEEITRELPLIELLASMLSGILAAELRAVENERQVERAQSEAETDFLTKLYNRRGFDRLLDVEEGRCVRYGHHASLIAVDLDGLKMVNDMQGHVAGDELIRRAATALRQAARESDVVARIGGDEFVILAVQSEESTANVLVERIRDRLADVNVEASIGMASRSPALDLEQVRHVADQSMYRDKSERKRRFLRSERSV